MEVLSRNNLMKQAVKTGKVELVSRLLETGVSANLRVNGDGGYLLHHTDNAEIASLLIEYQADIEARNGYGFTPLFSAVSKNNFDLVEVLLLKGANVHSIAPGGNNILHHAVEMKGCNKDIVSLLIKHGCSLKFLNGLTRSPLHVALANEEINWEAVKVLIENGVDITRMDKTSCTPVDIALRNKSCKSWMIKYLIDIGGYIENFSSMPDFESVLCIAVKNKFDVEIISLLSDRFGANPFMLNIKGCYPLHHASYSVDVVRKLLSLFSKWNLKDLDFPIDHIPSGIVNSLCLGSYANISNNCGDTPLLLLLNSHDWTKIDIIKELLQQGADVFARNYRGETPYSTALRILQSVCHSTSDLHGNKTFSSFPSLQYFLFNCRSIITEIIQLLIKYSLLKSNNLEIDDNYDKNCSFINTFIQDCKAELLRIEKNYYISPYEILDTSRTVCNSVMYDLGNKILDIYIDGNYPIYREVVIAKLRRPLLRKKILELKQAMFYKSNLPFGKLDDECLNYLIRYLCDQDLLNVIIAFYKPWKASSKFTSGVKNTYQLESKIYNLRKNCCPHLRKMPEDSYFFPVLTETHNIVKTYKYLPLIIDKNFALEDFHPLYANDNSFAFTLDTKERFYSKITDVSHYSTENIALLNLIKSGSSNVSDIQQMIQNGADFYIRDEHCNNLLHLAIMSNSKLEVLRFLLNCGVNMLTMNCFGNNPLHEILHGYNCHIDIVRIILEHSSEVNIYKYGCLSAVPIEIVKSLTSGCFVNVSNLMGNTPLHFAVGFSVPLDIIEELLKYGADISASNLNEETPVSAVLRRCNFSQDFPNTCDQHIAEETLKLFIKYSLAKSSFHESIFYLETLQPAGYQFIDNFVQKCKSELSISENVFIENVSIFQIINLCVHLNNTPRNNGIDEKLEFSIKNKFPVYSDIIISNLKKLYCSELLIANQCLLSK